MAFDTVSLTSSDDDVPLKALNSSRDGDVPLKALETSYVPATSTILKKHSPENCDFCEEVFLNKYDALIHNGKHIIIPLIKKEYHQCPLCLFYYTSRYKLKHHTRNKHKDVNKNPVTTETDNIKVNKDKVNIKKDIDKPKHVKENKETNTKGVKHQKGITHKSNGRDSLFNKHNNNSKAKNDVIKISDEEDDLPLLSGLLKLKNQAIKETAVEPKSETEKLKQALLKDVKVVIEKLDLPPEKLENSPQKLEITPEIKPAISLKVPDKIDTDVKENHKYLVPIISEHKTVKSDLFDAVKATNHCDAPSTNAAAKPRNRFIFDDDIDNICDDEVMKDLTKDCIVDMNLFDEPWFDELAKSITNDDVDDMVITIDDDDEEKSAGSNKKEIDVVYAPSTHHDELVKPGVYRCRKCQQMFPTRFNQIQHEMTHMHIRKPRPVLCEYCDRFIATKKALKDHLELKHRMPYRARTFQNCTKCSLKYNNFEKHLENYHILLRCHLCNKGFESDIDRLNHIRGHLVKVKCNQCDFVASELEIKEHQKRFHKVSGSVTSNFNLCEICCLFLKNKQHTHYVFGETVSELGSRLDCEHCGNKFFHLTQVRRIVKARQSERFTFEKEKEKKKVLTNKERLKNIQQRLKMINKLSRF